MRATFDRQKSSTSIQEQDQDQEVGEEQCDLKYKVEGIRFQISHMEHWVKTIHEGKSRWN